MRTLIQRVSKASVSIGGNTKSEINKGLVVLVGVEDSDTKDDIVWLCNKITNLRIFDDKSGLMNCSLKDVNGEILVVSQFTLYGNVKKGNRPSFIRASKPDFSIPMYEDFVKTLKTISGIEVQTGEFGADMDVHILNTGPVTIWIDSRNRE
ncbi:D-aminoacyl-tRNA deacylase [Ichthyobacterium seriolicida]|uniref:D-aminoacyl-tRNA deacylase n=1 Tax=Ichthyobacterium seriolicida TaxID=242600 RepID=A0A1J1DXI1_9FLAO|nr:D-aminoacyl-tRNA deacylase [Ichthyobacterium seriolicida]BAV94537.1 D-tyrosyl-tRNA deacylase [Ichthyobacterium seriolicida]